MLKPLILALLGLMAQAAFAQTFTVENRVSGAKAPLEKFTVGNRPQRVRIFESGMTRELTSKEASPEIKILAEDRIGLNQNHRIFNQTRDPKAVGYGEFAEGNENSGAAINPAYILCAADLLKLVKQVGDKHPALLERWKIDEINIFLKPVMQTQQSDYKLAIAPVANAPNDPAINVQNPIEMPFGKCVLPRIEKLEEALKLAHALGSDGKEAVAPMDATGAPVAAPVTPTGKIDRTRRTGP